MNAYFQYLETDITLESHLIGQPETIGCSADNDHHGINYNMILQNEKIEVSSSYHSIMRIVF